MEMNKVDDVSELAVGEAWELSFHGSLCDDRTSSSIGFCKGRSKQSVSVTYSVDDLQVEFDSKKLRCHQIEEFIREYRIRSVILDATSLGVIELALLLKAIRNIRKLKCSILYIEPGKYTQDDSNSTSLSTREFLLSMEMKGFKGIPTLTKPITMDESNSVVFFLGFEGYRLRYALEELNIVPKQCSLVFGVPSYKPGWEVDAFANNVKSISENDLSGRVYFCGADSPAAVLSRLKRVREMIGENDEITLIPIGPKPHAIGAILFYIQDCNSNFIYDHPIKSKGRTADIGPAHLYRMTK